MNFGIIGCGLIGNKRALSINKKNIIGCFDVNKTSSKKFSKNFNCRNFVTARDLIESTKIDTVLICTIHNSLFKYTKICIENGKNILVEKPAAKNKKEIVNLLNLAKKNKKIKIQVGYNHRFHPAIIKAKRIIDKNILGKPMYIRARYGHGARLNYHKEWRMNKSLSGGGELIDQGSHLIDLSRYFLGELNLKSCVLKKFFWNSNVEDNAFLILEGKNKKNISFIHCSCTEWKNKFSFEIFLQYGKLQISGLGGSYGTETLTCYKMRKKMGKPNIKVWKFKSHDNSWKNEIKYFIKNIKKKNNNQSDLSNAYENMKIIQSCYSRSKI